jgi:glycosyltransferase involved in cell wall biosynthesis
MMGVLLVVDFSVITPVYNGEVYLRETIDSVLANLDNNFSFEYLIIDDGSTDSSRDILEEYSSNPIIRVLSIPNGGEAAAVNLALKNAFGEYILIVNADDPLISSNLFSQSFKAFDQDPDVIVTYPDWNVISDEGNLLETKKLPDFSMELLVGEFLCLPGPGAIFRRSTALKIGGRNTAFKFVSDYDFWLRMSLEGVFFHIPYVLAQWREHAQSTSVNSRGLEMGLERIQLMEDFLKTSNLDSILIRKGISHAYYHAALLSYFTDTVPGRKWMFRAFIKRRGWIESSDLRVILFCLFLPISRALLPILNKTPLINRPLKRVERV